MSKYLKGLLVRDIAERLEGVQDLLVVNVVGMDANTSVELRRTLREKDIRLMVVRNRLARRAMEGTPLAPALDGIEGPVALCWGAEDFVSLTKTVVEIAKDQERFPGFETRGGVLDGQPLTPEKVKEVSTWPTRTEQLALLVGQILGPGAQLSSQLLGPGAKLASQIKKKAGDDDES